MSISPGQTVGNYRVLQQIGTGGMGAVYLAEHPMIGKKVALKVIHRELGTNREVVGRFFNEARAVNRIGNEHIVEVHDFGQSPEGYYFFLMEYLEGRTLAHVLAAERVFSVQRVLHIGAQICDALGAAHTAGIIHRDLKPDNVMLISRLGDPDFVKVLDFGLAKMFGDGVASNLTAQGVVLGTPQYMSPEACESKRDIDHRTDIYAVGVLLYQMLCGVVPFDGESMGEVLVKQVMHAPPPPRATNPTIPPSVEQIILRCLAKSPDSRFATMQALRDAILDPDRYLASSPPVVPAALARSTPGARTLFVDDAGPIVGAPQQQGGLGYAQTAAHQAAQPGRSTGAQLALRPPPPSMVSSVADAKTMFGQGMVAPAGGFPGAEDPSIARRSTAVPGMQLPQQPSNQTMVIGTPPGYKDRPPRRVWPIVVVLVLLAAGGGVAVAMMMRQRASSSSSSKAAETIDAAAEAVSIDAGVEKKAAVPLDAAPVAATTVDAAPVAVAAADAAPGPAVVADAAPVAAVVAIDAGTAGAVVAPILVTLRIETVPSGAEVVLDGVSRGTTPTSIDLSPGDLDHELLLRRAGMKDKKKTIKVTASTTLKLELEKAPKAGGSHKKGGGKGSGKGSGKGTAGEDGDDLMRPPWEKK